MTAKEKAISTLWIARDKDESLWMYVKKPIRRETFFVESELSHESAMRIEYCKDCKVLLCSDLFPEVTWGNSPQELIISQ